MLNFPHQFQLALPDWFASELLGLPECIPDLKDRMALIIRFSQLNMMHDTGGLFAAGVFEKEPGKLISAGVNRVVEQKCSSAHAEVINNVLTEEAIAVFKEFRARNKLVYNSRQSE
ncbi:cytidine/deoxycytidylate deaminase family protein [Endozoicomonas numazuensis]|uniref:hypothetical protein n=1 Tax=Endozoicomonas numazuensis TaxID=1137799 RepID=UPI00068D6F58|nr:hypothetical protein [Endozoicomonas numazuensis]